ncbi:hypothetical protein DENSPDRAFT_63561 [Dentipellis sp. KUC8613]|nr:hypothetical protein DENSPDRAFT_63561 [Dentipellis sp. KUC8613]
MAHIPRSRSPMFLHRRPVAKQGALAALSAAAVYGFPSTDLEGTKQSNNPEGPLQAIILALHEQPDVYGRDLLKRETMMTVTSVLGHAAIAGRPVVAAGLSLLQFTPVPGLELIGKTLLRIWDACDSVSANDHTCDGLVQSAARIVAFLRDEIINGNQDVREDLKKPLEKMNNTLEEVYSFIHKYAGISVARRLLKRDEIKHEITQHTAGLDQALALFTAAAPIHVLNIVLEKHANARAGDVRGEREHPEGRPYPPGLPNPTIQISSSSASGLPTDFRGCGDRPAGCTITNPEFLIYTRGMPLPEVNQQAIEERDARKYQTSLKHGFDQSLTVPLWNPVPVEVGAVGYFSESQGTFVTFFNALDPLHTSDGHASYIDSLAKDKVKIVDEKVRKFTHLQRGVDYVESHMCTSDRGEAPISVARSQTFNSGAEMYIEKGTYRHFKDPSKPKQWLRDYGDDIERIYGAQFGVTKRDIILVTGTLDARDYALLVKHDRPSRQITFDVFSRPIVGEPWGAFSGDTSLEKGPQRTSSEPMFFEQMARLKSVAHKVSKVKGTDVPWDTVLVAPLQLD